MINNKLRFALLYFVGTALILSAVTGGILLFAMAINVIVSYFGIGSIPVLILLRFSAVVAVIAYFHYDELPPL